ncbi:MAG: hypothetical protein JO033_24340 [Acidobacteriaceae bacterium]|nr:hypothetical protein [Acidobacteriaceae bacterium]MBV9501697.1 hypothetical protein [Acidobacteriaceae bacterium]
MSTRVLLALLLIPAAALAQRSGGAGGGFGHSAGPIGGHSASMPARSFGAVPGMSGGSFHRGPTFGFGYGSGHRGFRGGIRYRPGFGFYAPYFPLSGYDFYAPYSPLYEGDQYAGESPEPYVAPGNVVFVQPSAPAEHATLVIHEYKFDNKPAPASGERLSFTIVLKDGSTRSAIASWILNGNLFYIDSQSRQQLLAPEVIDRDATERANEGKNLRLDLPPG